MRKNFLLPPILENEIALLTSPEKHYYHRWGGMTAINLLASLPTVVVLADGRLDL